MKDKLKKAKTTTMTVWENLWEFVQAVSLVVVAAFSGYAVHERRVTGAISHIIAVSAAIIAVRGAYELLRHFNKK